jgi:ubiquinone/menaquinone biosynthesis C-methylase UbiE
MKKIQDLLIRYFEHCFNHAMKEVYENSPRNLIKRNENAVFLDCGCHNGEYTIKLADIIGTRSLFGIDINEDLAHDAKNNHIRMVVNDVNKPLPYRDDSFDVLTSFNLLEHLIETQLYLSEIFRVLKPGGYAILNTPNLASWHNIAALVLGFQPFSGPNINTMTDSDFSIIRRLHRRAHDISDVNEVFVTSEPERYRHIVVVAFRSLQKALTQSGFILESVFGFGYYPLPPFLAQFASKMDPSHAAHILTKCRKPHKQKK